MSVNLLFPHRSSLCYGCFLIIIIYLLSIYSFCTRTKHKEPIKFCYAVESFQCSEVCMNLCYIILQNWEGVVSWENFYFKLRDESLQNFREIRSAVLISNANRGPKAHSFHNLSHLLMTFSKYEFTFSRMLTMLVQECW